MFGYAVREGLIDPTKSVQIGIRTVFAGERTYGFRIIYADEVHESTPAEMAEIVTKSVGGQQGLSHLRHRLPRSRPWRRAPERPFPAASPIIRRRRIIRKLTDVNFVAMDVVEVSPPYDHADITSLAAASLVMEYLCLKAWQKGARVPWTVRP